MKKFSRLNQHFYRKVKVIIAIFLLLSLACVMYLVNQKSDQKKQVQPTNKISSNKSQKTKNINTPPSISIVVINLGLNKSIFEKAMTLPKKVTLGFSPYSPYLDYILELTQREKRDIIMNIPTDTLVLKDYSFEDNGAYALSSDLEDAENIERLNFVISKATQFNGYYTSINDSFTDTADNLTILLNKIKESQKYIMYNDPRMVKPFREVGTELKMQNRIIEAHVLIDSELEKSKIEIQLNALKNIAGAYGYAIGIARAYNISIDQINKWLEIADKNKKYNVIPLSELINERF